ncbi:alpha-galactosidase [Allocoprobacillus halotolerans]|uniref:alpha-galactosidase n=1 Tax=Allocoprobacillus halotolerans TaxID=2944914 RepID=A0ABY5I937_9FIRM|nr:alpha-galactosidase [Allocoprobacillus halotolerans]UTY40889.1 alpha-galactosidase [Allocoprobacillus halotolerans]
MFAFQLIYSGNFIAQAEMDQFGNVRSQIGINSDSFQWTLHPGESFTTPEAILNYSQNGLNEMSQNFHWLYQYHLMPRRFIDKRRPVLLNSWEGMYYDVSIDKIDRQTDLAKELGIDLFVLDDGWFRLGNTSESGIGDWQCNESKLPGGIKEFHNWFMTKV